VLSCTLQKILSGSLKKDSWFYFWLFSGSVFQTGCRVTNLTSGIQINYPFPLHHLNNIICDNFRRFKICFEYFLGSLTFRIQKFVPCSMDVILLTKVAWIACPENPNANMVNNMTILLCHVMNYSQC
jgi:hypothetical protein